MQLNGVVLVLEESCWQGFAWKLFNAALPCGRAFHAHFSREPLPEALKLFGIFGEKRCSNGLLQKLSQQVEMHQFSCDAVESCTDVGVLSNSGVQGRNAPVDRHPAKGCTGES